MNKELQQLHGIAKDLRNTNLTVERTAKRILNRLEAVEVVTDKERRHIEELFAQKLSQNRR